jgi:MarR family transcriptional regulator, transcriptional regulator for hemolysin
MESSQTPIGLLLTQTAKVVGRAFEERLSEAGGSTPTWLILLALIRGEHHTQSQLARSIGVQGPTLTHHLNAMEAAGLLSRTRRPENRRQHEVELTDAGRERFHQLREAAAAFDATLRQTFSAQELEALRGFLTRMEASVTTPGDAAKAENLEAG